MGKPVTDQQISDYLATGTPKRTLATLIARVQKDKAIIERIQDKSGRRKRALRSMNKSYMLVDRWWRDAAARARALAKGTTDDLTYELQGRVRALEGHLGHEKRKVTQLEKDLAFFKEQALRLALDLARELEDTGIELTPEEIT